MCLQYRGAKDNNIINSVFYYYDIVWLFDGYTHTSYVASFCKSTRSSSWPSFLRRSWIFDRSSSFTKGLLARADSNYEG